MLLALLLLLQGPYLRVKTPPPPPPPFEKYPAPDAITGKLALPRITTAPERHFQTLLRHAITKGEGVVDGGTDHERPGANFDGRYVLVQWGCGTSCMEAAIIDGRDGTVLRLPQAGGSDMSYFGVPIVEMQSLNFRWNSRLLIIACVEDATSYF